MTAENDNESDPTIGNSEDINVASLINKENTLFLTRKTTQSIKEVQVPSIISQKFIICNNGDDGSMTSHNITRLGLYALRTLIEGFCNFPHF